MGFNDQAATPAYMVRVHDGEDIYAAVASLPPGGGIVELEPGGYYMGAASLTLPNLCVLRSRSGNPDDTLLWPIAAGAPLLNVNGKSSVKVQNLHIGGGTPRSLFDLGNSQSCEVTGCILQNRTQAIEVKGGAICKNLLIARNRIDGHSGLGTTSFIEITDWCQNVQIVNNWLYGDPSYGYHHTAGIDVDWSGHAGSSTAMGEILIRGNTLHIDGGAFSGIKVKLRATIGYMVSVVGNIILGKEATVTGVGIDVDAANNPDAVVSVIGNLVRFLKGAGAIGYRTQNVNAVTPGVTVTGNAASDNTTDYSLGANTVAAGNA